MGHTARILAFGCVIAVMATLSAPTEVVAQKKKGVVDNGYAATPEDYKQIVNRKELTGSIVAASGLVVTVRIDTPRMEPNPKYKAPSITNPKAAGYNASANQQYRLYRDAQQLQRDLQQAQRADTPQERARAMQRYYQDMANFQRQTAQQQAQLMQRMAREPNYAKNNSNNTADPFIVVHSYKEFDLETTEKVVIRKMFLPAEYDDMGNLKNYTEKDKAALRGDDKSKPGYAGKMEEISNGMEAKLTLVPPAKKKAEAKADEEGVGNVDRPRVSMIVLTKDNPAATGIQGADPKKKKK
jgi:hypothetical protein